MKIIQNYNNISSDGDYYCISTERVSSAVEDMEIIKDSMEVNLLRLQKILSYHTKLEKQLKEIDEKNKQWLTSISSPSNNK